MEDEALLLEEELEFDFSPESADTLELTINDFRNEKDIKYPAVVLTNVMFVDCLRVLKSIKHESYRSMDIWVELPDDQGFEKLGEMQVDSDFLLVLRHLHINATIYYDADNLEFLDLENPDVLEKFV